MVAYEEAGPGRLADLFSGLMLDFTGLFRSEIALAKAEASEKVDLAVKAAIGLAIGAVLAIGAIGVFLAALVSGGASLLIAMGSTPAAANFVSAIVVTLVAGGAAWAFIARALDGLKADKLGMDRTANSLRADAATLKESF
jgi:hypothetical protein